MFPIRYSRENLFALEHLGHDIRQGLKEGDWVEIVDDNQTLRNEPGAVLEVESVDPVDKIVTLDLQEGTTLADYDEESTTHPYLRRWDQRGTSETELSDGCVKLEEGKWLKLEDGIQIFFQPSDNPDVKVKYRTGDYWSIPARIATGNVEWPNGSDGQPEAQSPQGIQQYYAPLRIISIIRGNVTVKDDCRCRFPQLCSSQETE